MPLVREAARSFTALLDEARRGIAEAAAARDGAARERRRILAATQAGFLSRLEASAPTIAALIDLDRKHGLGMKPASVVSRLREGREADAATLAETDNGRSRFHMQRFDAHRELREAEAGRSRASLDAQVAAQALERIDPAFLAVHAVVSSAPVPVPAAILRGSRFAGLLARRHGAAATAVRAYGKAGGNYLATRDGLFRPATERAESLAGALEEAQARVDVARARAGDLDALIRSLDAKRRRAAARLEETDAVLADPYPTVLSAARDWLGAHVAAFEAGAVLRDPAAADALSRMVSAGLLDEEDLTELGRRFLTGRDEAALSARGAALEGMAARLDEALGKLSKAERAGAGGRFVDLDVPGATRSLRAALAGLDAEIRAVDGRQAAPRHAAGEALAREPGALMGWMLPDTPDGPGGTEPRPDPMPAWHPPARP